MKNISPIELAEALMGMRRTAEQEFTNNPDAYVYTEGDLLGLLEALELPKPDFAALEKLRHEIENYKTDRRAAVAIKIISALAKKNMQKQELAQKLGTSASNVTRIVHGGNITLKTLLDIESALGINLLDLMIDKALNQSQS
jgi:DNA-binding Xre family transcriptional regulator